MRVWLLAAALLGLFADVVDAPSCTSCGSPRGHGGGGERFAPTQRLIVDNVSLHDVCDVLVSSGPPGDQAPWDLLGTDPARRVAAGQSLELSLSPGSYYLRVAVCDGGPVADYGAITVPDHAAVEVRFFGCPSEGQSSMPVTPPAPGEGLTVLVDHHVCPPAPVPQPPSAPAPSGQPPALGDPGVES